MTNANLQGQAYASTALHSLNTGALLNNAIANTSSSTYWTFVNPNNGIVGFPGNVIVPTSGNTFGSGLGSQLKMIARLIEAGYRSAANGGFGILQRQRARSQPVRSEHGLCRYSWRRSLQDD